MCQEENVKRVNDYLIDIYYLLRTLNAICQHEIHKNYRKKWPLSSPYKPLKSPKVARGPRSLEPSFLHFQQFRAALDDIEFDPPALCAEKSDVVCEESMIIATYISDLIQTLEIFTIFSPIQYAPYAAVSLEKKREYILHYLRTFVVTAHQQYCPELSGETWERQYY